jgi:lysozyme
MRACIGDVPLYQNEWDAYVSLSYNIGTSGFCSSTLVKRLKKRPPEYIAACTEILRWNRGGGRVLDGLTKRRQAEYKQCMER